MSNTSWLFTPGSLGRTIWGAVRSVGATLSIEQRIEAADTRQFGGRPCVFVLWHGRMFMPMFCYRDTGINIIVSEHRDGEIVTNTLEAAGFRTVRGSTTRGGVKALARLVKLARAGERVGFTADGPRGPMWSLQPGAVYVAAKTGVPVVPMTGSASHALYFGSWDRLQFPAPFSKAVLLCGEPYEVTGGIDPENIEYHRAEIERRLTALTREADAMVGATGGS